MRREEIREIFGMFCCPGEYRGAEPYGNGHINNTYLVKTDDGQYILQRINGTVFADPVNVMDNVVAVTEHLSKRITAAGGDARRETLHFLPAKNGRHYWLSEQGDLYRMYRFVDEAVCYQRVENKKVFYEAAKTFGRFQQMLADFDATVLKEIIPDFHNTPVRYRQLMDAAAKDAVGRVAECEAELAFAAARKEELGRVVDALQQGVLPVRVTHNDTKLNNVLFDGRSGKGMCVIDLDTVMPGSLLYDFGDSIRFGASSASEDETDLDLVEMQPELYEAYVKGYLEVLGEDITAAELELLPFSAKLLTLECGMRFLTDHLNGDGYFRIAYPGHNLDRARNQFKLVADMEAKMPQMEAIVARYSQK